MAYRSTQRLGFHKPSAIVPATYVGENHYALTGATQVVDFPAGCQAGDVVIMSIHCATTTGNGSTPAGWSGLFAGAYNTLRLARIVGKVLENADIVAGTVTVTSLNGGNTGIAIQAYRGATGAAIVSSLLEDTGATCAVPGFTKSASCRGLIGIVMCLGNGPIVVPAGWTERINDTIANCGPFGAADLLTPSSYTNGAAITWSGFTTPGESQAAWVIELT